MLHTTLKPREDELETVTSLHFMNELIDREVPRNGSQERFDRPLVAVDVEKTTDDLRRPD